MFCFVPKSQLFDNPYNIIGAMVHRRKEKNMELNNAFCELSENELMEVEGGVAPWVIYGGALLGGWLLGHVIGYFAG